MDMISQVLSWSITIIALIGTVFNAQKNKWGFVFWMVSNTGFVIWNLTRQDYAQMALFIVNTYFAVQGFVVWTKKEKEEKAA